MVRHGFDKLSRGGWMLTGLLSLAWLGVEDRRLAAVTLLAWMISLSSLMTARARRSSPAGAGPSGMRWWIPAGIASGALVGPIAAALILLKTGLHAHPTPDFSTAQIAFVLARIPLWAAAGGIFGAGVALLDRVAGG